jgi:hypothetical protein
LSFSSRGVIGVLLSTIGRFDPHKVVEGEIDVRSQFMTKAMTAILRKGQFRSRLLAAPPPQWCVYSKDLGDHQSI